jgi:hypothetical protein
MKVSGSTKCRCTCENKVLKRLFGCKTQEIAGGWRTLHNEEVRFQVLTAASTSLAVFLMEAANTSETSVNFYQSTRRNNPEDSRLHNEEFLNLYRLSNIITVNTTMMRSKGHKEPTEKMRKAYNVLVD